MGVSLIKRSIFYKTRLQIMYEHLFDVAALLRVQDDGAGTQTGAFAHIASLASARRMRSFTDAILAEDNS